MLKHEGLFFGKFIPLGDVFLGILL